MVEWREFRPVADATDCAASGSCATVDVGQVNLYEGATFLPSGALVLGQANGNGIGNSGTALDQVTIGRGCRIQNREIDLRALVRRQAGQDRFGVQQQQRPCQAVAATRDTENIKAQRLQRLHMLPDGTARQPEAFTKHFARVELAIRQHHQQAPAQRRKSAIGISHDSPRSGAVQLRSARSMRPRHSPIRRRRIMAFSNWSSVPSLRRRILPRWVQAMNTAMKAPKASNGPKPKISST